MLYHMAKSMVHELLNILLLVLLLDIHQGVLHVPEVGKHVFNRFLFKNQIETLYHKVKRNVHEILDVLLLVLLLDVDHDVHVIKKKKI
jgi:hypothetical protein